MVPYQRETMVVSAGCFPAAFGQDEVVVVNISGEKTVAAVAFGAAAAAVAVVDRELTD